MSITNGPNLGLMVNGLQGEAHYTQHMALLRGLDGLVMPSVKGYLINTPPGSPADGDCYIIGAAPTGAWAGQGGKVTRYSTVAVAWEFFTPKNGWMIQANSARETYRYTGGAWEIFYQEGTWTPVWTGLTVVSGTGGATYSGAYVRVGNRIDFQSQITTTGTATTSSAGGIITYFSIPFAPVRSSIGVTSDGALADIGPVLIYPNAKCYTQAWTARADFIFTSGTIFTL